jgi:hypothetical protein
MGDPAMVMEFPDQMSALEVCIDLQTARRQTSDGVIFSLTEKGDTLMQRGGDRRSDQAKSMLQRCNNDRGSASSARETASIIGCHYSKVVKIRTIRRDGTPEMQEAVKNNQMTIHKAWKMIRDMELGEDENKHSAAHTSAAKKLLTEENFEKLKGLPGDIHEKMNAAVEFFMRSLHDKESATDPDE